MNTEDALDNKIEDFLKKQMLLKDISSVSEQCPVESTLADYLSGVLEPGQRQQVSTHVIACERCFNIAALSLKTLEADMISSSDSPRLKHIIKKAADICKKNNKKPGKTKHGLMQSTYLVVAGVFFVLSFIFKRYFVQFLFASGIFSAKWIMDTGSTKALIMIYDTWKSRRRDDDAQCNRNRFKDA
jgi:hypothetical protein